MDKLNQTNQHAGLAVNSGDTDPSVVAGPRQVLTVPSYTLASETLQVLPPSPFGYIIEELKVVTKSGSGGTVKLEHCLTSDPAGGSEEDICAAVTTSNTAEAVVAGAISEATTYTSVGGNTLPVNHVEKGRWVNMTATAGSSKVVCYFIAYREKMVV